MFALLKKIFGTAQDRQVRRYFSIVKEVNVWDEKYKALSDDAIKAKTGEFQQRLESGETLDQILPEAYGVVKSACRRLMGTEIHVSGYDQKWDMVPYDVQIVGAIAMHQGSIAEMMTGEGKTLTAVMPLYLNALSGNPVHLVTVNDYLASRDSEWMGTVFRWLGLTVGALTNSTPTNERHNIYRKNIVYGTASEFGFDYLRDNSMVFSKSEQVQKGHFFGIIDEIDSILIDEARTPLIISGPSPESRQMYDILKGHVSTLVRVQRDFCNQLATEAKRTLDDQTAKKADREMAMQKLWLVSKGTPLNKILTRIKEDPDMRADLDSWDLYYYSDANKQEKADSLARLYMIIDERNSEYELTDKGISEWVKTASDDETVDDFVMLDISDAYLTIDQDSALTEEEKVEKKLAAQEEDAKRKERTHNLRQLLRAHLMMERDVDYIVQEGKIVIIDENTGRPQPGRRFSDGLHQSIEAKEGLAIQKETQTYATITLQNYFRMYDKLAGMTGTATTEANEFKQIYNLDVLEIPTNRPCVRDDQNDEIYMTEREKYTAIIKDLQETHKQGRPILIGTESVDISEKLARICKQNNLPHTILNAKNHEREAEIIAYAGTSGAITIATNMAGRGTDIKLGDGINDLGGLYVMGTTRHNSRRTDRQLRGRCARQGDPGSSKFYVSFEDSLLRLFASPRLTGILQKFRPPEGEPISAKILNRSIETAQKRIEQRNYMMRKHTLEYDDVMNMQRSEVYAFRNNVLRTDDVEKIAEELLRDVCATAADKFFVSRSEEDAWNPEGYRVWLMEHFPISFEEGTFDDDHLEIEQLETKAADTIVTAFKERLSKENDKAATFQGVGDKPAHEAIRSLMIRHVDKLWQGHLLTMDHLRSEVSLRAVGQRDPLMEFKHEAFTRFNEFGTKLRNDIAQGLFRFELIAPQKLSLQDLLSGLQLEQGRSFVPEEGQPSPALVGAAQDIVTSGGGSGQAQSQAKIDPIVSEEPKVGRNDVCPCGSGKKYKKCCGLQP